MSFKVNVCQTSKSFLWIHKTNVQKKKKNGKFYGREKLYWITLSTKKNKVRNENFTEGSFRSCFVTVSVVVGISVDAPLCEGLNKRTQESVQNTRIYGGREVNSLLTVPMSTRWMWSWGTSRRRLHFCLASLLRGLFSWSNIQTSDRRPSLVLLN